MKKRRLIQDLNFEDSSVISDFKLTNGPLKVIQPICNLSKLPASTIGLALRLEDNGIVKLFRDTIGEDSWKEKSLFPEIKDMTHFLPLYHSNKVTKAEVKMYFRPFRGLLDSHKHLQASLEKADETTSNGVLVLIIIVSTMFELVKYYMKHPDNNLEDSLKLKELFNNFQKYLERVLKLWKAARNYVISMFSKFICDGYARRDIFHGFTSNSEGENDSCFLFLLLGFSLGESFLRESFDIFLCHFLNQMFLHEVKNYTALNNALDIVEGQFTSIEELSDLSRQKLLFHYFSRKLRIILFISSLVSSENLGFGVVNKINSVASWTEFCKILLKTRSNNKYWMKQLLQDIVFGTNTLLENDTATTSQFRVHVIVSALCKFHSPTDTSAEHLMKLAQTEELDGRFKCLIPESKTIILKTKLLALDDNLEDFKLQYQHVTQKKDKLSSAYKQASLENANLKQDVLDLQDQVSKLEHLLKLERELHLVKNAKNTLNSGSKNIQTDETNFVDREGKFHDGTKSSNGFGKVMSFIRRIIGGKKNH